MRTKTLRFTNSDQAKEGGVEYFGDPNAWKLICKAYSEDEGWMKSTKAMEIPGVGCLVQVSTQQIGRGGDYQAVAEAITAIPGVEIDTVVENGEIVGRRLVSEGTILREEPEIIREPESPPEETENIKQQASEFPSSGEGEGKPDETTEPQPNGSSGEEKEMPQKEMTSEKTKETSKKEGSRKGKKPANK